MMTRRSMLCGTAVVAVGLSSGAMAAFGEKIHVVKARGCGCCSAWIDILEKNGFVVTWEEQLPADLVAFKTRKGVPPNLASCHTAEIGGYVIEGHVPVADIRRLLAESPDAVGLTVPDMPYGSPGMGPEDQREAYDVLLIARDGSSTVFTSYAAAG